MLEERKVVVNKSVNNILKEVFGETISKEAKYELEDIITKIFFFCDA